MSDGRLRYGRIAYVNVAPVETAFDTGAVTRDVVAVAGVPTRLNAMLLAGELDVSAVSSAFYLDHRDELALVGDCCIAADGPVRSVLLVSPVPPALLGTATIALTRQSASGRALLETLLSGGHGIAPSFDVVDDALAAAQSGRPALLIGDDALTARKTCRPASIHDLGEAWRAWTGLPFVFAVWAARRDVLAARPQEVAALADALTRSRAWGRAHHDAVVDAALARHPFHRALYDDYFARLSYVLDERARLGLARFDALRRPKHDAGAPALPQAQPDAEGDGARVAR